MRSDKEMFEQFGKHVISGLVVIGLIFAIYLFFSEPWNQYLSVFVVLGVGAYMMKRKS